MTSELSKTVAELERGVAQKLHAGAQLYVSLKGETVADIVVGEARPGVPMTTGTLLKWLSCSKPITAVAVAQLWEQGQLDLNDPVCQYLPDFAANGKEAVTIRHLLTHTGGFPAANFKWPEHSWDEIIERVCNARLKRDWVPGKRAAYHAASSWFILGQIVQQLTNKPLAEHVHAAIFEPLDMNDSWLSMSREQLHTYGNRFGYLYEADGEEITPGAGSLDYENRCELCAPGASGIGPLRELGRFYEMLLAGGENILRPATVNTITARHRAGQRDEVFGRTIDWGLGFIVSSNQYDEPKPVPYGFGPHCSAITYGHGGHETSISFTDPLHGLVVAWCCNGMPGHRKHDERNHAINAAIYEDLGLDKLQE